MVKKIGDLLREYFIEKGWKSEDPCSTIFLNWNSLVGKPFCEHTRPVEIIEGVLFIEADHPGWLQMFSLKKDSILGLLEKKVPMADIRDVRARLGVRSQ
jgi:predicted nucleic acid-binding Zn ribbon protein